MPDDTDSLIQDPNSIPQPLPDPNKPANEPTLEEVAAQIKAANSVPPESPVSAPSAPAPLTQPADIPSSTALPPIPTPDAISQLDAVKPAIPQPKVNPGQAIAKTLAENEVIGENQIPDVADVLTPELIQTLIEQGSGKSDSEIPISYTSADGSILLLKVPVKDVFDFLSGHTDIVKATK